MRFCKRDFQNVHAQVSFEVCKSRHYITPDVNYLPVENIINYIYNYRSEEYFCNRV